MPVGETLNYQMRGMWDCLRLQSVKCFHSHLLVNNCSFIFRIIDLCDKVSLWSYLLKWSLSAAVSFDQIICLESALILLEDVNQEFRIQQEDYNSVHASLKELVCVCFCWHFIGLYVLFRGCSNIFRFSAAAVLMTNCEYIKQCQPHLKQEHRLSKPLNNVVK